MLRRLGALAAASFAAAACLLPGLDELAGGDGGSVDAAVVDAKDSAPPDAVVDGGSDSATGFCATQSPAPDFCVDFDDGLTLDQYGTTNNYGGGTLVLTSVGASSPPRALLASTPALGSGKIAGSALRFDGPAQWSAVTFRFSAKLDPVGNPSSFCSINMGASGFGLVVDATSVKVQEGLPTDGGVTTFTHPTSYPIDWTKGFVRFELSMKRTGLQVTLGLAIDGAVKEVVSADPRFVPGPPVGEVGWGYVGGATTPRNAIIDDIVAFVAP